MDYDFHANQGPLVKVLVEGAKISKSRLHLLVPIFEEGTIDNDLLNEGLHNIRDYLVAAGVLRRDGGREGGWVRERRRRAWCLRWIKGMKHKVGAVTI